MRTRRAKASEEDDQKLVVDALTGLGYMVFETGKSRASLQGKLMSAIRGFLRPGTEETLVFRALGRALSAWSANSTGLPDLMITHRGWCINTWIGIEMKKEDGKLSVEQAMINDDLRSAVCYSPVSAISVMISMEKFWDGMFASTYARTGDEAFLKLARGCAIRTSSLERMKGQLS